MPLKKLLPILYSVFVLLFIHFYPKAIIEALGEDSPWTSYLYMYGLGTVVFLTGLWVILGNRSLQFGRGRDSYWFKVLIGGFFFFVTLHLVWILAALNIPYLGGA